MKTIICDRVRPSSIGPVVEDQGFCYRLDFEWAKWPDELRGVHTLSAAFDESGKLYVTTEDKAHPICIFSSEGAFVQSIGVGLFAKAHSIYFTSQGSILVADSSRNYHVIREITHDGELIRDFGVMGQPGDSGYDFDYLKVLEAESRVPRDPLWHKRAAANARLDSVKRLGSPFNRPCAMVMNRRGEYFAADGYGNDAVHKFNSDGSYAFSWGGPGQEPGRFRLVHGICIDSRDRIWVADRENSRVQVFDQGGKLLAIIGGNLMRIGGVWTDQDYAYIGELDGGVTILDLDWNLRAQLGCQNSVIHAHGITGDREGNLYILTNKNNETNILRLVRM